MPPPPPPCQVVDSNFVHEKFTPGLGRAGGVRDALVVATGHKVFSLAGADADAGDE